MNKQKLSPNNPSFRITRIIVSADNQYFFIGSDEGKVYIISQANIDDFGVTSKPELSPITDLISYIEKNKLKIAVTYENGRINFFECVNLNVNFFK